MPTSLLYTLFRIGRVPSRMRPILEAEGVVALEEGLAGSLTYRNFRGHRKYSSHRRTWFAGSLCITRQRLVAFAFGRKLIDLPHSDPRRPLVHIRTEEAGVFLIEFDASLFAEGTSGEIAIRLRSDRASALVDLLLTPRSAQEWAAARYN